MIVKNKVIDFLSIGKYIFHFIEIDYSTSKKEGNHHFPDLHNHSLSKLNSLPGGNNCILMIEFFCQQQTCQMATRREVHFFYTTSFQPRRYKSILKPFSFEKPECNGRYLYLIIHYFLKWKKDVRLGSMAILKFIGQ